MLTSTNEQDSNKNYFEQPKKRDVYYYFNNRNHPQKEKPLIYIITFQRIKTIKNNI